MTLWIGPRLGSVERACLISVIRQGHPLALYCYAPVEGVPHGVEIRDAAQVLPQSSIIAHRTGSVALFANRFRYELQRRNAGTWVDCDAYLLAPLDGNRPYLMGEEQPGRIANGILRIPADSPMLAPLLALFEERSVPDWLPFRARLAAQWRLFRTGRSPLSQMPWGVAGPGAVTALARKHDLYHWALPPDALYPVHWSKALWILDPSRRLQDMVGPTTVALHLFNEMIKGIKDKPAPSGSFLEQLQREGAC